MSPTCQDREHPTNKDVMALTPPVTVVAEGPCVAVSSRLEGGAQGLLVEAFRAWQQGQRMAGTHDLGRLEKIMVASLGLLGVRVVPPLFWNLFFFLISQS